MLCRRLPFSLPSCVSTAFFISSFVLALFFTPRPQPLPPPLCPRRLVPSASNVVLLASSLTYFGSVRFCVGSAADSAAVHSDSAAAPSQRAFVFACDGDRQGTSAPALLPAYYSYYSSPMLTHAHCTCLAHDGHIETLKRHVEPRRRPAAHRDRVHHPAHRRQPHLHRRHSVQGRAAVQAKPALGQRLLTRTSHWIRR